MAASDVGTMLQQALLLTLKLAGPPLAAGLVVGLLMSLLQAATQINEPTLAFVPKVVAIALALFLTGGFMLQQMLDFTHLLFDRMVAAGG